jgi:hypothetical protein
MVQLGGPTYKTISFTKANSTLWTVDGAPGVTSLSANTWHLVRLNLAGAFGASLVPGTTRLNNAVTQFTGGSESVYMDAMDLEQ